MNKFKLNRNLWLLAGVCFFLSFLLNLASNQSALLLILNGTSCILMFINAYINHRKVINED